MPEIQNDYYSIAVNDYQFLAAALHTGLYNQISVQCQQIAEKLLKSVAEEVCTVQVEDLLKSHNLKKICQGIHNELPSFQLDIRDMSYLKDFYFDAKYPGENFAIVTKQECEQCLSIMYDVFDNVNRVRCAHSQYTYLFVRQTLS